MKKNCYTVYDQLASVSEGLFLFVNDALALREFKAAVNSSDELPFLRNLGDKQLYKVGVYDDETLEFTPDKTFIVALNSLKGE